MVRGTFDFMFTPLKRAGGSQMETGKQKDTKIDIFLFSTVSPFMF